MEGQSERNFGLRVPGEGDSACDVCGGLDFEERYAHDSIWLYTGLVGLDVDMAPWFFCP